MAAVTSSRAPGSRFRQEQAPNDRLNRYGWGPQSRRHTECCCLVRQRTRRRSRGAIQRPETSAAGSGLTTTEHARSRIPIKANDNSGIFHVPGGRFYDRTVPERCYAERRDAEADGYRRRRLTGSSAAQHGGITA